MNKFNTKSFGLALPGQGQYGMSYFGQIRQFNEFGFYPDLIQTTSMGSYQGQFFQFQIPFKQYFNFLNDMNNLFNDLLDYIVQGIEGIGNLLSRFGFYDSNNIINVVKKHIPDTWNKMKIPIQMTSFDVNNNKEHIFGYKQDKSIPPYLAIVQSGCTQPFQTPIKYNNMFYIDGGYVNNLPINLIKDFETKIVISPDKDTNINKNNKINNLFDFLFKIVSNLSLKVNKINEEEVKKYIHIISGVKDVQTIFDFHQYKENMELGYERTKEFLNNNKHLFF